MDTSIATTLTKVEKLRKEGKILARTTGRSLQECYDEVARSHGYQHWKHVTLCQKATSERRANSGEPAA